MAAPTVLLTHLVRAGGASELAAEIRSRLPDVDLVVAADGAETREHLPSAEVVVTQRFPDELLAAGDALEWLQVLSAGYDFYDLDAFRERGIAFTNASGVHAEPIAEQILAYMLVFQRNVHRGIHQQRDREWEPYFGFELADETAGIVGLGAIGSRTAELCSALGMDVVGTKRDPSTAPDAAAEVYGPDGLDAVLERADYLVVSCPLTDETRGLLGAEELATLDPSAVVVNVARGAILEEAALVDALEADELRGAALDVFEEEPLPDSSPLWDRRDVVVTPHMAGSTPHYWERCADLFAENYERYLADKELRNRIV